MENEKLFNLMSQFAMPGLTIMAQAAIALKFPEWGLIINMIAQPFWLYSGWKSYRQAGQIGFFIATIITTLIIGFGLVNYWFL